MECQMKGGICFPMFYEYLGRTDIEGYALMAGLDIETGIVYVFEQTAWTVIDNILHPDGSLRLEGLSGWVNRGWLNYFARVFYFHQADELARRHRLQVLRSRMIEPKPNFVELPPTDAEDIIGVIWRFVKAGRLRRAGGTVLEDQLQLVKSGDRQVFPAVHALGCCLTAFELHPWRKPYERPIREVIVPADKGSVEVFGTG
jgi:hypothetical protein